MTTRLTPAVAAVATVALVLTACGTKDRQTATPRPRPTSSPSATPSAPADAALTAYRGMWNAFVEAAKTSNADAPELRTYAQGDALKAIISSLITDRERKSVSRGEVKLDPKVTALEPSATAPTTVTITDCVDSTQWLQYKADGGLWDNEPGARHRATATVKSSNGIWRVDSFTLRGGGTC